MVEMVAIERAFAPSGVHGPAREHQADKRSSRTNQEETRAPWQPVNRKLDPVPKMTACSEAIRRQPIFVGIIRARLHAACFKCKPQGAQAGTRPRFGLRDVPLLAACAAHVPSMPTAKTFSAPQPRGAVNFESPESTSSTLIPHWNRNSTQSLESPTQHISAHKPGKASAMQSTQLGRAPMQVVCQLTALLAPHQASSWCLRILRCPGCRIPSMAQCPFVGQLCWGRRSLASNSTGAQRERKQWSEPKLWSEPQQSLQWGGWSFSHGELETPSQASLAA